MFAVREVRLDAIFGGREPELLDSIDLDLGERLDGEIAERRTAPKRQRFAELLCCPLWRVGSERTAALLSEGVIRIGSPATPPGSAFLRRET